MMPSAGLSSHATWRLWDYQESREVTIATITRPEVGLELFGPPSEARTYMLDVQVKVLRDVKSGSSDLTWLTVEVGQAGTYV